MGAVLSGTGLIIVGATALGFTAILACIGFTSAGVAAGSIAAGIQSVVYGGAATGLFSICQSLGASGRVAPGITAAGCLVIGAGFTLLWFAQNK